MNIKQIFLTILLIVWMLVIFLFSNQSAKESQKLSDGFISKFADIFSNTININISTTKKNELISNLSFFVRKCAHFFEYFILGILVFLNLNAYHCNRKFIFSILFCFLYACTDEFHQIFLNGRAAKFFDIFIDTLGGTVGSYIIFLLKK